MLINNTTACDGCAFEEEPVTMGRCEGCKRSEGAAETLPDLWVSDMYKYRYFDER